MRWYLSRAGAAEGPFDEHVLVEMIRAGQVPDHSHVAAEGGSAWQPVASHAPFASARAPAAAPVAPMGGAMAMDGQQVMSSGPAVAPPGAAMPASASSASHASPPAAQPAGAASPVAPFAQSPVAHSPAPSHASAGPAHAQPSFGGAPTSTHAASAPGPMGSDPLQPGMLPLKKSSPMLPVAGMIILLLAAAFCGYSFTHYRGVAGRYEDTAEFHRGRAQGPAEPGAYYSPEDHARRAVEDDEDADQFARRSWMYCAGSGFTLVLALGMLGLFLVLRRKVKLQHAEVDRIAAARREAGLDPFTGKPRAAAPPSTGAAGLGGGWQPQNEVDTFVLEAVRDMLEPGEIVRGAGVLFRDAPVIYMVLQILGTIAGILPSIPFIFLRAGQQKIWFAVHTDRRLLLVRTKRGGFSGAPKRMNLGVAGLPYADVAAVQRKGSKMTVRTRDGRSHVFVLIVASGGLSDAQRFRSEFPGWLERHVAAAAAA